MRPGALTQAARNAASRQGNAGARSGSSRQESAGARGAPSRPPVTGARNADRRRAARAAAEAGGDRRVTTPSRPPRRVSGPARWKGSASQPQEAARPARQSTAARPARQSITARATRQPASARARQAGALRASRPVHTLGVFASGSAAVAAAVALPLRRPFIGREPAPRPTPVPAPETRKTKGGKPAIGIARGVGAFVVSLPDHPWLDRVVRGRVWIPLLGVLLAGIVAAQVEILKLGASMGRSLEQTTTLTSQNELLRDSVASLSDDQRIEWLATNMGMVLPPPGAVGYLGGGSGGKAGGALANIHAPDATGFMALTPSNGALVTGPGTSMLPTSSGVLAQAGTPGSATPTSTPSPTSTVPSTGTAGSGASTTSTTGTSSGQTGSTASQAPPAEQPPPANTQTPTGASQTSTDGAQPTTDGAQPTTDGAQSTTDGAQSTTDGAQSTTGGAQTGTADPQSTSTGSPTTGAAAIQPGTTSQQGTGG